MNRKWKVLGAMFAFVRPYAPLWVPGTLLYSMQSFATGYLISLLLSQLTAAMLAGSAPAVWRTGAVFAGAYLVYFVLLGFAAYQYVKQGERATFDMKKRLFRAFVSAGTEDAGHSGEGIASLNTEADAAANLYGGSLSPFIGSVSAIVLPAVVIFTVDWRLGFMAVLIGAVAFLVQSRFSAPLAAIAEERLTANREGVKAFANLLSGAAVLRVFNLQSRMLMTFDRESEKLLKLNFREATIAAVQNLFTTVQGWLTLAGVFGIGGWLVAAGRLELAALMLVPNLCVTLCEGMAGLGGAWAGLQGPLAAADRVAARLDGAGLAERDREPVAARWDGDATLRVRGLTFGYRGSERDALSGVDLTIAPNRMVALVGASGSGKSTLLRVLIGLYGREHLPISIGSLARDELSAGDWRRFFAYVDQSAKLFDMTVAENIALGRPGATRTEIEDAARGAMAHDFIIRLPQGYDTPCGERGASLSGGQRQRIAIARALVRKVPILVFDEATSALDAESGRQVMETIARLRRDHTVLLTTHNLVEIEDADEIVVLHQGRVVQSGGHEELLRQPGEYSRLLRKETA